MRPLLRSVLLAVTMASFGPARVALGGEVTGGFRLFQQAFVVGEPILVEFSVRNGTSSNASFFEGGDYRGTLRHHQFSFHVESAAGRDFTQELQGHEGGEGDQIALKPGLTFRSWQLLGGWTHLLPPGRYRLRCARDLVADPYADPARRATPVASFHQDLSFEVVPYERERIVSAVADLHRMDASREDDVRLFAVPVEWAVADVNEKFQMGLASDGKEAEFEKRVLAALPATWDNRYYVEYGLSANRNWLTPEHPEDFVLTFTARNNGNAELPHGLGESTLALNESAAPGWRKALASMREAARLGPSLAPGAVVRLTGKFNDLLPPAERWAVEWTVRDVRLKVDLRRGR